MKYYVVDMNTKAVCTYETGGPRSFHFREAAKKWIKDCFGNNSNYIVVTEKDIDLSEYDFY